MAKRKPSGASDKQEKILCLYHQNQECICIRPVKDKTTLKMRLESQIRLNTLNARHAPPEKRAELEKDNEKLKNRLDLLV